MADSASHIVEKLADRPFETVAPAKLNLALRVVGRRVDGYHLLEMVNVILGLHDSISVRLRGPGERSIEGRVEGVVAALPADFSDCGANLAARAADRFLEAVGLDLGYAISIVKRIPSGAGLGGGSSDAAAVLRLLGRVLRPWGVVPHDTLEALALRLGADVPFFLGGTPAIVRGVGERVEPIAVSPWRGVECLVVIPPVGVPTPDAYKRYRERYPVIPPRRQSGGSLEDLVRGGAIGSLIGNDLEEIVTAGYPEVGEALRMVRGYPGIVAGMTGSGSAIFCLPATGVTLPGEAAAAVQSITNCPVISTFLEGGG